MSYLERKPKDKLCLQPQSPEMSIGCSRTGSENKIARILDTTNDVSNFKFEIEEDLDELRKFQSTVKTMSGEDFHDLRLMTIVQCHPCIYNRSHALHKEMTYRNALWSAIANKLNSSQLDVEKKWRHLRDKYVRLRKMDKTWQPLKPTDKWYWFYQKMNFLDHHVEHRNRKKRNHDETKDEDIFGKIKHSLEASAVGMDFSDSGDPEEVDALQTFYSNMLKANQEDGARNIGEVKPFKSDMVTDVAINVIQDGIEKSTDSSPSPSASVLFQAINGKSLEPNWINIEVPKDANMSPSSTSDGSSKKLKEATPEDDSEVTLFVRSIAKSLKVMDPRTFALARFEISRVLFDCQFGRNEEPKAKKECHEMPYEAFAQWVNSMAKPEK